MTTPPQAIRCVAVEAGKIAALGTEREAVARGAPAGAEVLHWPGGFVLPGLWDTHVHVAGVGEAGAGCALYDARSIDEIVRRLGDHARRNSRAKVILARAANLDAATLAEGRLPTAADLDRAEPDRPVVVTDVNKRVANSAAMRFVGLTAAAPDPPVAAPRPRSQSASGTAPAAAAAAPAAPAAP